MLGVLDHNLECVDGFLARESSNLSPRNIGLGARNRGADRGQQTGLIDTSHFDLYRTRRLNVFFPGHLDLAMGIAFENRRTADRMNGNAPSAGDKPDDLFAG